MHLSTRLCIDLWLLFIQWLHCAAARQRHATYVDVKDKIIELQCFARCAYNTATPECLEQCHRLIRHQPRIGHCPAINASSNTATNDADELQQLAALQQQHKCQYDNNCPDVQKCCETHVCKTSICMDALNVRDNNLLPPIPKIQKFKLPRGHKVEISVGTSSANTTFLCHVESRWHIGLQYTPRKMGHWHWQPVEKLAEFSDTRSKRTDVAFNLKPSRWYQVRVAAINAYGFRGYSEPSAPFSLLNHPKKPMAPADLTIISQHFDGKTYSLRIIWCPSKSNIAVEKYKIIWSLYVEKSMQKDPSYISNAAFVKDANQFKITKLQPNSVYYIQVQAISKSGKRRLKSDTCSRIHNVTEPEILTPFRPLNCSTQQHGTPRRYYIGDLDSNIVSKAIKITTTVTENTPLSPKNASNVHNVRFRLNRKIGMVVQISGFKPHTERIYKLCPKETNCDRLDYSVRTKKHFLEFSRLNYNTTYVLQPHGTYNTETASAKPLIFQTPRCESLQQRFPKIQIKC